MDSGENQELAAVTEGRAPAREPLRARVCATEELYSTGHSPPLDIGQDLAITIGMNGVLAFWCDMAYDEGKILVARLIRDREWPPTPGHRRHGCDECADCAEDRAVYGEEQHVCHNP